MNPKRRRAWLSERSRGADAFDFCKGLGVSDVMLEVKSAVADAERAGGLPSGPLGDTLVGGGECDIGGQGILEGLDGFKVAVRLGKGHPVAIDAGVAPAMGNGGGAANEINPCGALDSAAERGAEGFPSGFVGKGSHVLREGQEGG